LDSYEQQVEYIARAFYDAQDDAGVWDSEPEPRREEFRQYARDAITLYRRQRLQEALASQATDPISHPKAA
jgi:hypothetical protein